MLRVIFWPAKDLKYIQGTFPIGFVSIRRIQTRFTFHHVKVHIIDVALSNL